MSFKEQLMTEMKEAMKAGDKTRLGVIRYLRSQIKNFEIDHGEQDDESLQKLVAKEVKQVKEAIDEYQKGGREDLVEAEEAKLEILKSYLPEQLKPEELRAIVKEIIDNSEQTELGPIIGQVMAKVKNQADGGQVAALVKEMLE